MDLPARVAVIPLPRITHSVVDTSVNYAYCWSMDNMTVRDCVEFFHLVLLSFIGKKVNKGRYALKGGCNLRFFFGSPRYSDDMDIDIADVPVHALRDTVNSILGSASFTQLLRLHDVTIEHTTEHKQTDTTQRWKLGLHAGPAQQKIPTKVEFSRRGLSDAPALESVSPVLLHRHRLPPIMAPHYSGEVALFQKIDALATRSVTQARDIFDLYLLLSRSRFNAIRPHLDPTTLQAARSNALGLSFDAFKGQVVAFLAPEDQETYDSTDAWESMQLSVLEMMEDGL